MKSFRVLSASVNPTTGFIEVVKEITADDNSTSLNLHTFHPEALEWKAAELGLTDPDEIIDGILHEPFFQDVEALQLDVGSARALFRTRLTDAKAKFANASPRNAAAIKALLGNAGVAQRHIDAVDSNPIQTIKNICPFDAEVLAVKQQHVDKVRNTAIAARGATKVPQSLTPSERAARLAQRRSAPKGDRAPSIPVEEPILPPVTLNGKRKGITKS